MPKSSVNVKLTLEVSGEEQMTNVLEFKGTTIEQAVRIENGLADLIKNLNSGS
jgi:hypothetical protein